MKTDYKKANEIVGQLDKLIERMLQDGDTSGTLVLRDIRDLICDMTSDVQDMRTTLDELIIQSALARIDNGSLH